MERRRLGKTNEELSVIGFGGLAVRDMTPDEAAETVARAVKRGINYFDVAPSYGNAEERLGPALEPFRDDVFLACKTGQRDAAGAESDLHQSLQRLRTDHFDLYQCHGVSSVEEAERILAPGGALETFVRARDAGTVRHIGFSAHSEAAALKLLDGFPFESVLMPFNLFCWEDGNFGRAVLEKAGQTQTGVLALKSLARRPWEEGEDKTWPKCWYRPVEALREATTLLDFTLCLPVTAAVSPGHAELLWLACDAAEALANGTAERATKHEITGAPLFKTGPGST